MNHHHSLTSYAPNRLTAGSSPLSLNRDFSRLQLAKERTRKELEEREAGRQAAASAEQPPDDPVLRKKWLEEKQQVRGGTTNDGHGRHVVPYAKRAGASFVDCNDCPDDALTKREQSLTCGLAA